MGAFLLDSRRAMHKKGKLPWAFHDFWLKDMAHAMSDDAALVLSAPLAARLGGAAPDGGAAPRVFFPGCQLGASDPAYVLESYRWLLSASPDAGLWLSCCGAPAVWSGDAELSGETDAALRQQWEALGKPELVFACPTCRRMFADFLPESDGVFLYDIMRQEGIAPRRELGGRSYSVFDPCSTRHEPILQTAVRELALGAGAAREPLADEGEWAKCCSWGGHVSIANPDYAKAVVGKRVGLNELPYITYCVNCRDIFAEAGKESLHILDILFDLNDGRRLSPGFSERRENRAALRRRAADMAGHGAADEKGAEAAQPAVLRLDEALRRKLAIDLVLEEDARRAVERCESEGRTVTDPTTGHKHGYAEIGRITCWVEYKETGAGEYRLVNAYSHRMAIDLEETWHGQKVAAQASGARHGR
jgi:hypothetical protein